MSMEWKEHEWKLVLVKVLVLGMTLNFKISTAHSFIERNYYWITHKEKTTALVLIEITFS